jgi:HSP20 family protein
MNSEDDENNRRRRENDSFDIYGNKDEFNRIFDAMERMMQKAYRDMSSGEIKPGKSFVRGFNVHIGPDGKPRIQEFGNFSKKDSNGSKMLSKERKPLVDIIENHNKVAITAEVPGVEKEDINLEVKDQKLEIKVVHPNRKYHKIIDLPCDVKPKTTKATYKNGVLDIEIEKKQKGQNSDGYKVDIE